MADALNHDLTARKEYPYAVGVRFPTESKPQFFHFNTRDSAQLYAELMDGCGNVITLWRAVGEPEYNMSAATPGWRQVTWFA